MPDCCTTRSMSHQTKSRMFAPHVEAPKDDTAYSRAPNASAAANTAKFKPGKEPENVAHTVSPFCTPASYIQRTTAAAHCGFVAVRLACKSPSVVVASLHDIPMSPVALGSTCTSSGYSLCARSRAMCRIPCFIRCSAFFCVSSTNKESDEAIKNELDCSNT